MLNSYVSLEKDCFAVCGLSFWLYTAWSQEKLTHVTFLNLSINWESDALDKVGYCMKLYSASFTSSILPCPTTSRAVTSGSWTGIWSQLLDKRVVTLQKVGEHNGAESKEGFAYIRFVHYFFNGRTSTKIKTIKLLANCLSLQSPISRRRNFRSRSMRQSPNEYWKGI